MQPHAAFALQYCSDHLPQHQVIIAAQKIEPAKTCAMHEIGSADEQTPEKRVLALDLLDERTEIGAEIDGLQAECLHMRLQGVGIGEAMIGDGKWRATGLPCIRPF